ncbi:MAG TPA: hypothetical protein VNN79_10530 [Actinomycetota bacterium]|nr:hypothetical protein [Actinomycetota bacterium]
MATTIDRPGVDQVVEAPEAPTPRRGRGLGVLSGAALVAVAAAAVFFFWPGPGAPKHEVARSTPLYTKGERTTMRLVHEGLVPAETLQGGIYRIKSLINQGLIPRETLDEYVPPIPPLYTPRELKIIMLVQAGILPKETLDGEPFRTKRLINAGYIPRSAAYPAPTSGT